MGDQWVHLRLCLECGHGRLLRLLEEPARAGALPLDRHPIIQSAERGEDWRWCYVDEVYL